MLLYILGMIFNILGFVGYYCNIHILLILSFIFYVCEMGIGLFSGKLNNINTPILAAIIGGIIAFVCKSNIIYTIMVALCYESAIMTISSVIYILRILYK